MQAFCLPAVIRSPLPIAPGAGTRCPERSIGGHSTVLPAAGPLDISSCDVARPRPIENIPLK